MRRLVIISSVAAVIAAIGTVAPATSSAAGAPHWNVVSQAAPTYFHAGDGRDFYEIVAINDGTSNTSGEIVVSDTLPAEVTVNTQNGHRAAAYAEVIGVSDTSFKDMGASCVEAVNAGTVSVTCKTTEVVPVGRQVVMNINVSVPPTAAGLLANTAVISGGGAPSATANDSTPVVEVSTAVPFGVSMSSELIDLTGVPDVQAGSHPFALSTITEFNVGAVDLNEKCVHNQSLSCAAATSEPKDVQVNLPVGLVGSATAVPYCTQSQFEGQGFRTCPASSQVGSMYLYFYGKETPIQYAPVYNIEPPPGQPAEFGFSVSTAAHIPMFFHVRSDDQYELTADLAGINQYDPVRIANLLIWGTPAAEAHNALRTSTIGSCKEGVGCAAGASPKPLLRTPTHCGGGVLSMTVTGDSWQQPQTEPFEVLTTTSIAGMTPTSCEALSFSPTIADEPSGHQAGAPSGYSVHLDVPQNEESEKLASPDLRDAEVTLPDGTVISPSAANGLTSCDEVQFGLRDRSKGSCPPASRIGTVKVTTPLLASSLTGNVYVGQPECSPCSPSDAQTGKMVRLFVEADGSGVIVKLSGHTRIDEHTGQLTTVFTENPQLPFSDFELALESGEDAPLVNPSTCGTAITTAKLTPWSTMAAANVSAGTPITGCGQQGFTPAFSAGMTKTAQAGAFSGFSVVLSRKGNEQTLGGVSVTTPQGLLGVIKNVPQCPESQANAGTCPTASQIGSSAVTVGPGNQPYTIPGGKVYLTAPYKGQPFGLSIVTSAQAGPFTLSGNTGTGTEVVRASIGIDSHTAQVHVTSDPLPTMLDGIPLDIRQVVVTIDREGFMFNPTNCDPLSVSGQIASTSAAVANVSYPFQAVNCATLGFKPKFTASTQAKTSKANGAALVVKVVPTAGQANIGKVRIVLPKQLPARLTTLQKACTDAVFNANPSACPAASVIGTAVAHTSVLAGPLMGPIYLVSHGGEAFPDAVIVLQGEGITLYLDGNTNIKKGITSSTFNSVPDAPVTSFEAKLPEGPHSAFGTDIAAKQKGSLCGLSLTMPTTLTGQNGAVVTQTTKIGVTGCPKKKGKKASSTHHGKGKTTKKK